MCVTSNSATGAQNHLILHRSGQRLGQGQFGLACWLALPRNTVPGAPPLVAVHGIRRGADLQATLFAKRAAETGRPVIAPIFDQDNWPSYQQAFLRGRADLALLDLVSALRREGIVQSEKLDLFGFSGGAQFVHRFAMLHPERVAHLSIASPGWYTFPDEACYPYGLSQRPGHSDQFALSLIANLKQFLALPMAVCVGEHDCKPDKNTRSGPVINAQQGVHRMARAQRWSSAIRAAAIAMGIKSKVQMHVLKDCGHDFEACIHRGGLGKIVVPEDASVPQWKGCRGTCSTKQRLACPVAGGMTMPDVMEGLR